MSKTKPRDGRQLKFVKLQPVGIERPDKKWLATFEDVDTGKKYIRYFGGKEGGKPYADYTTTGTEKQRDFYRRRHNKDVTDSTEKAKQDNDEIWLVSPGMLSMFLLWGDSKDLRENVKKFKADWLGGAYLGKQTDNVVDGKRRGSIQTALQSEETT